MLITFKKNAVGLPLITNTEVEGNEYYHENSSYKLFIDSNLPLNAIDELCKKTDHNDIQELVNYILQDGILIAYDKKNGLISVVRDDSGLGSLYYYQTADELIFSTNMHAIARLKTLPLLKTSVAQWLTFDFLLDGQTLYQDLKQVLVNQQLVFNKDLEILSEKWEPLVFKDGENKFTEEQNIKKLREEIVKAHSIYLRDKNIVFLSGGIDSVAMLIALDDLVAKDRIENHSFRVKGTLEDETVYAKSIADFLKIDLKIVERDLTNDVTLAQLKDKIRKLNNPYPGIWIFANQINNDTKNIYYAGQDTRLHTPSLNMIDKIAFKFYASTFKFKFFVWFLNILLTPFQILFEFITRFSFFKKRFFLGLRRMSYITNMKEYVSKYYFKQDKNYFQGLKLPEEFYEVAAKNYNVELKGISTERELYNYIVSVKWKEQYVNDIRYMIDMVKEQGGRLAMPFYNRRLTQFSSTIPFKLANKSISGRGPYSDKEVKINKYVLRQAFRDKTDDKTYYRAKAISSTAHIIYNQVLTRLLRDIIEEDLVKQQSIIKQLNLKPFIDHFQSLKKPFEVKDGPYLLKIYYLCCVIVYADASGNKLI